MSYASLNKWYNKKKIKRSSWHHHNNMHSSLQMYNRALLASQHQEHTSEAITW